MDRTLFLLSSSHHQAPLDIREGFAVNEARMEILFERFQALEGLDECLLLSTCNRLEIYGLGRPCLSFKKPLLESFCELQGLKPEAVLEHSIWKENKDAVEHLFEVASGLSSQMLGETEILGQLKRTFAMAQERSWVGPILNRIFQKSFQAAKWARTHTDIGSGQVSVGSIATSLALRIFKDLAHTEILVIGTGEIGEKTAQAFKSRGGRSISVSSRRYENAMRVAQHLGGDALSCEEALESLMDFDIIIGATSASQPLVTKAMVQPLIKKRGNRPLFLVDLAVPRDFEPELERLPNVYLYNLDDLAQIASENQGARRAEVERCKMGLKEKAAYVWEGLRDTAAV